MSSYSTGIAFDSPDENGSCHPDPDIASIGVVTAFVVAAIATTASPVAAAFLDGMVMDEKAFLPVKLKSRLNRGLDAAAIKNKIFYRRVLDRLILSFADQQLITGFALVLTGYIKLAPDLGGAHFTLIVYLSCLSSSSHLASVITLRKYFGKHQAIGILRVGLIAIFALLLVASLIAGSAFGPFFAALNFLLEGTHIDGIIVFPYLSQLVSTVSLLWTAIIELLPDIRAKLTPTGTLQTVRRQRQRTGGIFQRVKDWGLCVKLISLHSKDIGQAVEDNQAQPQRQTKTPNREEQRSVRSERMPQIWTRACIREVWRPKRRTSDRSGVRGIDATVV